MTFLLDALHEDLNRVLTKPNSEPSPEREAELEKLPQQIASEQEWEIYKMRNDSLIVDYFQGQFRNKMECLTCHHVSGDGVPDPQNLIILTSFIMCRLQRPIIRSCIYPCRYPRSRVRQRSPCTRAWMRLLRQRYSRSRRRGKQHCPVRKPTLTRLRHCPKCKTLRSASKILTLSRLPPVLLIHLKRFSVKGHFTDKIETTVDFPLKGLDLTNYMPPPLPPDMRKSVEKPTSASSAANDPRVQVPPYRYDLYGVTNHFGSLSNGHCACLLVRCGFVGFGLMDAVRYGVCCISAWVALL